jgi:protein involved in polysaccharide export with SLBB domain
MFRIALGLCVWLAGATLSFAQPASNGLVPSIAPFAPKASPREAAAIQQGAAPTAPAAPAPAPVVQPPGGTVDYDYVLGSGDRLRIIVFGEPTLTAEYAVAGNGTVSFPMVGDVRAAGRTVRQVRDEIVAGLKNGYIRNPEVSAEVVTYRPFFILGEVTRPGEYPYSDQITVTDAVATAGGFTYRANRKWIFIKHHSEPQEHRVQLRPGLVLQPGDTVRIGERLF